MSQLKSLYILASSLVVLGVPGCAWPARSKLEPPCKALLPPPARPAGVEVNFDVDKETLPEAWTLPPIMVKLVPAPLAARHEMKQTAIDAIQCYPANMINLHLSRICLAGSITYEGGACAGLYHDNVVIAALADGSPRDVAITIHHEISSILLYSNRQNFNTTRWMAANPAGFNYMRGSAYERSLVEAPADSNKMSLELMNRGFLTPYSMISLEEDFNVVASALFLGDARLWMLVDDRPKLHEKFMIAIDFYHSLDSSFTESFFRTRVSDGKLKHPSDGKSSNYP